MSKTDWVMLLTAATNLMTAIINFRTSRRKSTVKGTKKRSARRKRK